MRDRSGRIGSLDGAEIVAYRLARNGRPYAVFQSKDSPGLPTSRLTKLEPLPEGSSLELAKVYVMGAAAGYIAARHQGLHRMAQIVRRCDDFMPTYSMEEAFGMTADHLRKILTGTLPAPLKGKSLLAIQQLGLDPEDLAGKDDGGEISRAVMRRMHQLAASGRYGGPGQGWRNQSGRTGTPKYSSRRKSPRGPSRRGRRGGPPPRPVLPSLRQTPRVLGGR